MKIQIVTEKEPWEVFLETRMIGDKDPKDITIDDGRLLLADFFSFLKSYGNDEGICLVCERKFRLRKEEAKPKKGKKLDV
jgi:hypothetical protein